MKKFLIAGLLVLVFSSGVYAQRFTVSVAAIDTKLEVQAEDDFHGAMVQAIKQSVQSGELTRRKALRLRVRLLSPAFRAEVEEMAVTQMAFSEDAEWLPRDTNGMIEVGKIDWMAIADFLERLIPMIQQLIQIFGIAA